MLLKLQFEHGVRSKAFPQNETAYLKIIQKL